MRCALTPDKHEVEQCWSAPGCGYTSGEAQALGGCMRQRGLFYPSSHPRHSPGPDSASPLCPGSPARFPSASETLVPSFRRVFLFPGTEPET